MSHTPSHPCPRCGIIRVARNAASYCQDCRSVDPVLVKRWRSWS